MNKLKMLTLLTICCVLAGLTAASAQSVISQQQIQQKMQHNKTVDQLKIDAMNSSASTDDQKIATLKDEAQKLADLKTTLGQQQANGGYLPIPGFTATGNPAVDGPAYATAKEKYMRNDPAGWRALITSITPK